jgi:hypothetical protein
MGDGIVGEAWGGGEKVGELTVNSWNIAAIVLGEEKGRDQERCWVG